MGELVISSNQIIGFCAFISAIWGVWKIVKELRKPNDDLRASVEKHEKLLSNDHQRLSEIEQSNRMILKTLLVIINHDITGNGIDKLKTTRDELQAFLIDN